MSNGATNSATSSCRRWYDPAGFARRVASRARSMLCEIPMLISHSVDCFTSARMISASSFAGSTTPFALALKRLTVLVTSIKASSTDTA